MTWEIPGGKRARSPLQEHSWAINDEVTPLQKTSAGPVVRRFNMRTLRPALADALHAHVLGQHSSEGVPFGDLVRDLLRDRGPIPNEWTRGRVERALNDNIGRGTMEIDVRNGEVVVRVIENPVARRT